MERIMREINNFFYKAKEYGKYSIINNKIKVKGVYLPSQYIRIMDSILNDGVYKIISFENGYMEIEGLQNEEFEGWICGLSIPKTFIELTEKIKEYEAKNPNISNVISESYLNGYSYSKATNAKGQVNTWRDMFNAELSGYRQLYDGFRHVKEVK